MVSAPLLQNNWFGKAVGGMAGLLLSAPEWLPTLVGFAIGMACGAISTHMVVCGFTGCEMFKLEYTTRRYRWFTLLPAIGVLGVAFSSPLWMPIVASAIALTSCCA